MNKTFRHLTLLLLALAPVSCSKSPDIMPAWEDENTGVELSHGMMELGEKLDDPYSLSNMTKALSGLYPTKATVELTPTDRYVRFLPRTEEEYCLLEDLGIDLLDHPLDHRIIKEGDWWHDPSIPEDMITWQYAVLPHDFELPRGISYEILDDCYIPENAATKVDGIDWAEVEREAFRITGNAGMLEPATKAGTQPSGRITIVDPDFNEGQPFGLAGVKVVCNVFVKFASAHTSRDGYYTIPKSFSSSPRYRLMFENSKGFDLGFNLVLVPASLSTLGKGPASGIDSEISVESDRMLFCRAAVSSAAFNYFERCAEDDMDIKTPPKGLRIWLFKSLDCSSTPMMRHGTILDKTLLSSYLGDYLPLVSIFLPDITIGIKDLDSYSDIYAETVHELSHASHFAQVGKDYWDNYIMYILKSFVHGDAQDYGSGDGEHAGECEIGEMWAYFMQNTMMNDRYGGSMPTSGTKYWFHPQIFRYLYERGMTRSQIFKALQSDVTTRDALYDRLIRLYPDEEPTITPVFERYE